MIRFTFPACFDPTHSEASWSSSKTPPGLRKETCPVRAGPERRAFGWRSIRKWCDCRRRIIAQHRQLSRPPSRANLSLKVELLRDHRPFESPPSLRYEYCHQLRISLPEAVRDALLGERSPGRGPRFFLL